MTTLRSNTERKLPIYVHTDIIICILTCIHVTGVNTGFKRGGARCGTLNRWIVILTLLSMLIVVQSFIPEKYPIEVYRMLQERTQFGFDRDRQARGSWGSWSPWSECSRSCGTGIQSQARECVPFRHLRRRSITIDENATRVRPICIGTYKRYHVCNTQECSNFSEDLRTEQCAKYNGRIYKGHTYAWVPFLDAPNSCALNCRAIGERFYATLEPTVLDGTPCSGPPRHGYHAGISMDRSERWLCVAGQCKSVGCDGVVGSGVNLDACGVCGGEGKGCRLFEGIFMEPILPRGYQPVTTIPRGAMSLNISELRYTGNLLVLKHRNGSYVLNGPWSLSPSGTYKAADTTLTYQRGDRNRMESILATGSLKEPLDLEILYQELNPGVLYKYMLPLNETPDNSAMIAPPFLAVAPAGSSDRGNEIPDSSALVTTVPVYKMHGYNESESSVSNRSRKGMKERKLREEMKQPPTTMMAGDQPNVNVNGGKKRKKFAWKVVGLSPCTKACGGGVQHAIFKCIRESNEMVANDKRCRNIGRPPDPPPLRCNDRPCAARWRAGPWSDCSVTCGAGTQTRQLECIQELNSKLTMRVAAGACVQPPDLKATETCRRPTCSNSSPELRHMYSQHIPPKWNAGPWGPCSTTCGRGMHNRTVTCITTGEACPLSSRPDAEKPCEMASCPSITEQRAPWLYSEWSSECSAECGHGVRTRQVACADGSELFCNPDKKPITEKQCFGNGTNCNKAKWFTGPWSSCTVSCGVGTQHREIACIATTDVGTLKALSEENCEFARPASEQGCRKPACSAEWFTSDWSECSKTCGGGLQERSVRCIHEGVSVLNCSESNEPSGRRLCNTESCKRDIVPINKPSKKAYNKADCTDKYPNCNLVVKAGLCRIKYYKHSCCGCRDR